ncbi:hypothetical protein OAJ82_02435, partial [Alphaproteobacteria bacterium]|nr:hypothetical protein [Alphaproteobacteria bacterium]
MLLKKNKLLSIFLFLIIFSCSDWEFVYKDVLPTPLKEKTEIIQSKTNSYAYQYIKQRLGNSKNNDYKLFISYTKNTSNLITKKDQTASKIKISYLINYLVENIEKKCEVYRGEFETNSYYNSK